MTFFFRKYRAYVAMIFNKTNLASSLCIEVLALHQRVYSHVHALVVFTIGFVFASDIFGWTLKLFCRSMVLLVYFIFSCRLWSLLLTTRTSFVLGFLSLFWRGHCFEGGNKGVWARKNVKYNWISQWTQICVYPCTEYICLCARNTVNNGSETWKYVE
jgi:uncharacterized membrane protein